MGSCAAERGSRRSLRIRRRLLLPSSSLPVLALLDGGGLSVPRPLGEGEIHLLFRELRRDPHRGQVRESLDAVGVELPGRALRLRSAPVWRLPLRRIGGYAP